VAEEPIANPTVLAVVLPEDRMLLGTLFARSSWRLEFTVDLPETRQALRRAVPGVVICDGRLPDGHLWKDLLSEMANMEDPPPLIVADRLADDRLWAEVLNLGAYDLLAKPFHGEEVWHAVTAACRCHEGQQALARQRNGTEPGRHKGNGANSAAVTAV